MADEALPAATEPVPELDPDDPSILRRPFTADQIREEWVEGFSLIFQTVTPTGETRERWTVLAADAESVEIEFAPVDPEGNAAGEARVARSSWVDLRNHASFPVETSRREAVTRETALGQLEGWLYQSTDPEAGTESELFFARSLPGAPVHMKMTAGGEVILEMAQVERRKPS